ncbi:cytochrome P450 [Kitasatospora sp. NPDC057223]|uniref:cytochrome P450 n=1 Tax=Kitasatospora sp. NPDC057223 TaxID=3346055 RepID=UPI00362649BE
MTIAADLAEPSSLDDIDLYPVAVYQDGAPHHLLRRLRAHAPVWRQQAPDGTPFWSVTRYRDVVDVLLDTDRFSSEHSTMLTVLERDSAAGMAIHLTDPPRHRFVRSATVQAMSMRVLKDHEAQIRQRIHDLVADMCRRREVDFAALTAVLPMLVAGSLMGIPADRWEEASRWTVASMAAEDPAYSVGDAAATLRAAHVYLFTLFVDLLDERRANPGGDDLVSRLIRAEIDGRPATDDEVLVNCYAFIMGANPTIPQGASHFVRVMSADPALWQRVRSSPELRPTVLEETLRFSSPVNHLLRRTREQVEIHGVTIPSGALVAAWLTSANRDESVFAEPDVFDPARQPNPHVAFGYGPHRCVGNAVAQTGLRLLIDELVDQVETIAPAGPVRHLRSNFLNGITELPVVLTPAG